MDEPTPISSQQEAFCFYTLLCGQPWQSPYLREYLGLEPPSLRCYRKIVSAKNERKMGSFRNSRVRLALLMFQYIAMLRRSISFNAIPEGLL